MTANRSAVAYRTEIVATLASAPGDSLTNLNTFPLPDGSAAFVLEDRSLWRLDKTSAAGASPYVVVPAAGPGRWRREVGSAAVGPTYVAGAAQNSIDSTSGNTWLQPQTNAFVVPLSLGSPFVLTAAGCILTYTGPDAQRFLATLAVSLNFAVTGTLYAGVSLNDDLTGTDDGFVEGTQFAVTEDGAAEDVQIACQRVVILSSGNTIRPKFRAPTDVDMLINRLTLTILPL